jgi:hypothetical protein
MSDIETFNRDPQGIPESRRMPTLAGIPGGERASELRHAPSSKGSVKYN